MADNDYTAFLERKRRVVTSAGIDADRVSLPRQLFDWQAALFRWALRKGRCALFADTGLGKTFMQLAWAAALDMPTLILAPLCVAEQTVTEALKLGIVVRYVHDGDEVSRTDHHGGLAPIWITNYERLDKFDPSVFGAVVLDESSILKAFDGETRNGLIRAFTQTPYRLCCTATPSPNDITELANHADERHICPLQLGTIERCLRLWSNPGELVCSPFAGIGSEGYEAIRLNRRFLGFELKASYAAIAVENLRTAELRRTQGQLFAESSAEAPR